MGVTRPSGTQSRLRTELIGQLIRKDLKVKYQGSTLGFLWSLANPLLILVVYTFVFAVVFKSAVPYFGLFLMSGMLIWNFFTMGVSGAKLAAYRSPVGKTPPVSPQSITGSAGQFSRSRPSRSAKSARRAMTSIISAR